MKRLLSLIVIIMSVSLMLYGCGSKKPVADNTTTTAQKVKAGFIYIGEVGEAGFTYSHDEGRKYLEKELGVETVIKESVPEGPEVEAVIKDMIDKQGVNVIFATSYGYMDYVDKMSRQYPNVKFLHCSGSKLGPNMSNYFGRMEQARYLTGIVAGLKTNSNKLGYVAAFEIPEVVRGINAFLLGAQSVNPDVKLYVKWTNTWFNPQLEKDAAFALIDQGVDVIAQHQDTVEAQLAAQEKDVWSIGYHSDMSSFAPKAVLTSAVWNWGPYYVNQIKAIQNGTWKSQAYYGGMEDDIINVTSLTENAPQQAKVKVNEVSSKIKNGTFNIFSGPIYNNAGVLKIQEGKVPSDGEILSMDWLVRGVEVVK